MAKKKNRKVIRYRRNFHINVGMIIFFLIFVYMAFYVYSYIRRDKVQFYEVEAGGIVNDKNYTGLILRTEEIQYTDRAGYINYYIREGKRVSVGSPVYSLDETGSLSDFLAENPDAEGKISEEDLSDLKRQLSAFSLSYEDMDFSSVADTKHALEASVMEYRSFGNMEDLDAALAAAGISYQQVRSSKSGIVSYAIDGFSDLVPDLIREGKNKEKTKESQETEEGSQESSEEGLEEAGESLEGEEAGDGTGEETSAAEEGVEDPASQEQLENDRAQAQEQAEIMNQMTLYSDLSASSLTEEYFDKTKYIRNITKSGELIEKGAPAYKLITSEDWSLVFPLSEEDIQEYNGRESLEVSFAGHDLTATGDFSIITGADGKQYGKLDFQKYVVQFASERFVDFEILSDDVKGLKIPVSSVTSKDFYLVPVDYATQGGDSSEDGFMKEIYGEDGSSSVQFTAAEIYYSTDEYYYVDKSDNSPLKAGDYIVKPGSVSERYQIGPTASLQGVYNINKGYAVFRQIEVLSSNDEYYTIEKGTPYGLSVYDHIVLDAGTVQEGEIIYQ